MARANRDFETALHVRVPIALTEAVMRAAEEKDDDLIRLYSTGAHRSAQARKTQRENFDRSLSRFLPSPRYGRDH